MGVRLVPALVALAVLAAGCSGDGGGDEASPTRSPVTESPSESPAADEDASERSAETPEDAEDFVRFFYETVEKSYQSQDPEPIRSLSDDGCMACAAFIDTVEGLKTDGARIREGYAVDVVSVEAPELEPGRTLVKAVVVIDVTEFVRLAPDGQVTTSEPPLDDAVQNVILRREGNAWLVSEVTQD